MESSLEDKKHVKELLYQANIFIKNHSHDGGELLKEIKCYAEMLANDSLSDEKKHVACVLLENFLSVARAFDESVSFGRK